MLKDDKKKERSKVDSPRLIYFHQTSFWPNS